MRLEFAFSVWVYICAIFSFVLLYFLFCLFVNTTFTKRNMAAVVSCNGRKCMATYRQLIENNFTKTVAPPPRQKIHAQAVKLRGKSEKALKNVLALFRGHAKLRSAAKRWRCYLAESELFPDSRS